MSLNRFVSGKSQVYAVIGHPIKHTLSPIIHNSIAQAMNHDLVYVPFHVYPNELRKAIDGANALQIQGINVTIPHKQGVMPLLVSIDKMATQIGAVNTLKRTKKGYIGYNTDATGLLKSLTNNGIKLKDKNIFIIGAGGAARAVAMMAANEEPASIWISNRTLEKAEDLAREVRRFYNVSVEVIPWEQYQEVKNIEACFQTTSIGMSPNINQSPVENLAFYDRLEVAVDLIYNPEKTLFLSNAQKAGCKIMNGFGMLFFQAVKAYEIWNDIEVPVKIQEQIMDEIWIDFCQKNQLK